MSYTMGCECISYPSTPPKKKTKKNPKKPERCELTKLKIPFSGPGGGKYTWSNTFGLKTAKVSRLDRPSKPRINGITFPLEYIDVTWWFCGSPQYSFFEKTIVIFQIEHVYY